MAVYHVEYSHNNSGGDWWLEDKDWYALEKAGWTVAWFRTMRRAWADAGGRFLGALASSACKDFEAISGEAAEDKAQMDWEDTLGMDSEAPGCPCCGRPHAFYASQTDCWVCKPERENV